MSSQKVILITGATGALGSWISCQQAQENTHLILMDQSSRKLEKLEDQLMPTNAQVTLIPLDFKNLDLIEQLAKPLADRVLKIDHVHACHGMLHDLTPTDQLSPTAWHQTYAVNIHSLFHLIRLTFPFLRQSENPTFTAYSCPILGAYDAAYTSSKAAAKSLIACVQAEQENQKIKIKWAELDPFDSPLRRKAFPNGDPRAKALKIDGAASKYCPPSQTPIQ
jgi:short-subunit dehydrogenase